MSKPKILHVITGLTTGGAEMMLWKLVSQNDQYEHVVVVLNGEGNTLVGEKLKSENVTLHFLKIKEAKFKLAFVPEFLRILKNERPDIIQSWMYHANLISLIAKIVKPSTPLVWNVRHSLHDISRESRRLKLILKLSAKLSKIPNGIVYNSYASETQHLALGFSETNSKVLANGFDLSMFSPQESLKASLRKSLDLPEDAFVFIVIGRFHPMKGHTGYISSFANTLILLETIAPHIKLYSIMVGPELSASNKVLTQHISCLALDGIVKLLGERSDISEILNVADALVLPSLWGEGFSNVLGEAMSLSIPAIATDVGDSSWILGESGTIVAPGDLNELSSAMINYAQKSPSELKKLGSLARSRMEEHFSIASICQQYNIFYQAILTNSSS
tara:strand:+ start:9910 stop:11076 length:1167 start_codon:yes stop_codon:yes gene_type:complete